MATFKPGASKAAQKKADALAARDPNEYALYVEFGTHKMHAEPFMRPALAEATGYMPDLLAAAMED